MSTGRFVWVPLLVAVAACQPGPEVPLEHWTLTVDGAAPRAVTLPAALDLPECDLVYRLRTEVVVPAPLADHRLQLVVPALDAEVELLVDGREVDEERSGLGGGYRRLGPQIWHLPDDAVRRGRLDVELVVAHRWTLSGAVPVAPRLAVIGHASRATQAVAWLNEWGSIVSIAVFLLMALRGLEVFVADRRQRAYLWIALQAFLGATYPAFLIGLLEPLFGRLDVAFMASCLALAILCGHEFTCAILEQPRPGRPWRIAALVAAATPLVAAVDPHRTVAVGAPAICAFMTASIGCQIWIAARQWRSAHKGTARYLVIAWSFLLVVTLPDGVAWNGQGELFGGARLGPLSNALVSFTLSLLLGQEHSKTIRQRDALNEALRERLAELERHQRSIVQLNVELRRQLTDGAARMSEALALSLHGQGPVSDLYPGDVIRGRYRVEAILGSGGMGAVYQVVRISDERRLAVKVPRTISGEALARLAREAHMAATVQHPNLVSLIDVDVSPGGFVFLVMELVAGDTLKARITQRTDPAWALQVLAQVARGLAALHAVGIVHRDLKPSNILISDAPDGAPIVKIADFGIALNAGAASLEAYGEAYGQAFDEAFDAEEIVEDDGAVADAAIGDDEDDDAAGDDPTAAATATTLAMPRPPRAAPTPARRVRPAALTRTGRLSGTPSYIAPEIAVSRDGVAPPADVFALGVIAFQMLGGRRPFARAPVLAILEGRPFAPAPPLTSVWPDAPEALVDVIARCLADDPDTRPTADWLADRFAQLVERFGPRARVREA